LLLSHLQTQERVLKCECSTHAARRNRHRRSRARGIICRWPVLSGTRVRKRPGGPAARRPSGCHGSAISQFGATRRAGGRRAGPMWLDFPGGESTRRGARRRPAGCPRSAQRGHIEDSEPPTVHEHSESALLIASEPASPLRVAFGFDFDFQLRFSFPPFFRMLAHVMSSSLPRLTAIREARVCV
jgi:hypothetical protein